MPRRLSEQVVVITGASSGIGRETALAFAREGAAVVLAARNREALDEVALEVERLGGRAIAVPTDVADWAAVETLARTAKERFGRIDTWVNDAAVSEYATIDAMTPAEIDRLVRVNLVGTVYGAKAAFAVMREQGAGTIVNIASGLAERSVPLQSIYCATKAGVRGFTEALRLEARRESPGIAVSLVLPSSINTPLFQHARSKVGHLPMPIAPVYEPGAVANAVVEVARKPRRDVVVGGSGKLLSVMERISPALLDWYMLQGDRMFRGQVSGQPDDRSDNLFEPSKGTGSATGAFGQGSKATSVYTRELELHPARKAALVGLATVATLALVRRAGR